MLIAGQHRKTMHGGEADTTNNRMELMDGIRSWLPNWKKRGWKTAARKPVKNKDLWQALDEATSRHDIRWVWVKGHDGNPGNEEADSLANLGIDELNL